MRLSALKRNKFDWPIYQYCLNHPEDPNTPYFMEAFEQKYGRRKHDPDLHAVARAFVAMGGKA